MLEVLWQLILAINKHGKFSSWRCCCCVARVILTNLFCISVACMRSLGCRLIDLRYVKLSNPSLLRVQSLLINCYCMNILLFVATQHSRSLQRSYVLGVRGIFLCQLTRRKANLSLRRSLKSNLTERSQIRPTDMLLTNISTSPLEKAASCH